MHPDHGVAQDGQEVNLCIVKDPIYEVGGVIHQHTPICGRKYVVGEYPMKPRQWADTACVVVGRTS